MHGLGALARWLYDETLADRLVSFKGLPVTHQVLTLAGYLGLAGLLIVTLLVEILGPGQPTARFVIPWSGFWASQTVLANLIGQTLSLPWLALTGSLLAFALGWTYLLSGATDCRRRIALPILAFFGLQLFSTVPMFTDTMNPGQLAMLAVRCLFLPGLLALLVAGYGLTYRSPRWQTVTWLKWLVGLAILLGLLLSLVLFNPQPEALILNATGIMIDPFLLTVPWWLISGLAGVDLVIRISRLIITGLRRLLPADILRVGSVCVTLAHPLAAGMLMLLNMLGEIRRHTGVSGGQYPLSLMNTSLLFETGLALALILILVGLVISKRWTLRNAMALMALNLALPFFTLTLSLALFQGRGTLFEVVELVTTPLSAMLPMLTFVVLMAYSALELGAGFANSEGRLIPRRARLQLGLGAALLIIAFTLFFTNLSLSATSQVDAAGASMFINLGSFTTALTAISLIFLGFPYLLWTIWKHPQRLIGVEPTRLPLLASLDTYRGRTIAFIILAFVTLAGLCLCCAGLVIPWP